MGKVVKAVAVVGIAIAIAVAAPYIAGTVLALSGMAATAATAAIAAGLTFAASFAMRALAPAPHTGSKFGDQPTAGQTCEFDAATFERRWVDADRPLIPIMAPRHAPWWRDEDFLPWGRYATAESYGSCMVPTIPPGRNWMVIDRKAVITSGDIFLLRPDDMASLPHMRVPYIFGTTRLSAGLVKRFLGVDEERQVAVFECTNPPTRMQTGLKRIITARRVVSWHRSWWAAKRAQLALSLAARRT